MKLTLGFSPCPNDTFIFDALVNKKIDLGEFEFDVVLEDVETLNQWALQDRLDITKLSFPAFFQSVDHYIILNSGSALGKGVGPILISKEKGQYPALDVQNSAIALPGENTTANLLFSFAYPEANKKVFMRFDKIEDFVLHESVKASPIQDNSVHSGVLGVIIHENRFTYQQKGLHKVVDLGEFWEEKMKSPIPLGAIAIKRKIERSASQKVNELIKQSLEYAYANYPLITDFVKENSKEMSEEVMRQHIGLYVNNYSLDLGAEGRQAIETLRNVYKKMNSSNVSANKSLFL